MQGLAGQAAGSQAGSGPDSKQQEEGPPAAAGGKDKTSGAAAAFAAAAAAANTESAQNSSMAAPVMGALEALKKYVPRTSAAGGSSSSDSGDSKAKGAGATGSATNGANTSSSSGSGDSSGSGGSSGGTGSGSDGATTASSSVPNPWRVLAKAAGRRKDEQFTPVAFIENEETDSQAWVYVAKGGWAGARWQAAALCCLGPALLCRPKGRGS